MNAQTGTFNESNSAPAASVGDRIRHSKALIPTMAVMVVAVAALAASLAVSRSHANDAVHLRLGEHFIRASLPTARPRALPRSVAETADRKIGPSFPPGNRPRSAPRPPSTRAIETAWGAVPGEPRSRETSLAVAAARAPALRSSAGVDTRVRTKNLPVPSFAEPAANWCECRIPPVARPAN